MYSRKRLKSNTDIYFKMQNVYSPTLLQVWNVLKWNNFSFLTIISCQNTSCQHWRDIQDLPRIKSMNIKIASHFICTPQADKTYCYNRRSDKIKSWLQYGCCHTHNSASLIQPWFEHNQEWSVVYWPVRLRCGDCETNHSIGLLLLLHSSPSSSFCNDLLRKNQLSRKKLIFLVFSGKKW